LIERPEQSLNINSSHQSEKAKERGDISILITVRISNRNHFPWFASFFESALSRWKRSMIVSQFPRIAPLFDPERSTFREDDQSFENPRLFDLSKGPEILICGCILDHVLILMGQQIRKSAPTLCPNAR
jgi:hypothetical protein